MTRPSAPKKDSDDMDDLLAELLAAAPPVRHPDDSARPPRSEWCVGPWSADGPLRGAHVASDLELFAAGRATGSWLCGQRFLAKVVDVYDGDTIRVAFRHGGVLGQYRARLAGYDSPELKPPRVKAGRDAEIQAALAARDALLHKLCDRLVFVECGPFDRYGRLLVTVFTRGAGRAANGEDVSEWMVANGHGVPYVARRDATAV